MQDQNSKCCRSCGAIQPLTEFTKDKHSADGLKRCCRKCCKLQQEAWLVKRRAAIAADPSYQLRNKKTGKPLKRISRTRTDGSARYCAQCRERKELSAFSTDNRSTDGLDSFCRDCKAIQRLRRIESFAQNRVDVVSKFCIECTSVKPINDFHRDTEEPDGYNIRCKVCRSEIKKAQYWLNRERERDRAHRWYQENSFGAKQRSRVNHYSGEFVSLLDEETWLEILELHGFRCARCETAERVQIDHIVPLSRGGTDHPFNVQPLCIVCNTSKGNRVIVDYRSRECRERYPCTVDPIYTITKRKKVA